MKIKPLVTNQIVFTWLCVCPADEATNKWKKFGYIAFILAILTVLLTMNIASATFFVKNFSNNFEEALYALSQLGCHLTVLYEVLISLVVRHNINAIFAKLSEIYEDRKLFQSLLNLNCIIHNCLLLHVLMMFTLDIIDENDISFRFIARANNTSEWLWKNYIKFSVGASFLIPFMTAVSLAYCWFINGQFDINYVYLSHKLV